MLKLKKAEKMYGIFKGLEEVAKELQKVNELYHMIDSPVPQKLLDKEMALEIKAQDLANKLGLHAVHQRNPRGSSIFLTRKENENVPQCPIEERLYLEY